MAASLLALTTTAVIPAASADTGVQPNIVGGTGATGNTSWMASLQYDAPDYGRTAYHTCGAVLVFRQWVVTGAQCVTDDPSNPPGQVPTDKKTFSVRVGSKDRTKGGQVAKIKRIVVRAGWNWGQTAPVEDLVMAELDHPLDLQPLQLAPRAPRPGTRIRLYGWGADDPAVPPTSLPRRLQQLDTTVVPAARCANAFQSAGEFCTDNPHGTDGPGNGDSGSPAVQMVNGVPQLVGTCSRGGSAVPGEDTTVYTSVPDFRRWIYDVARDNA
ncbi:trypsin-like serine protease [Amycolatopsis mediterranei S699]|uniref:Secreted trypsin-like serine protease n=2 Tax=Amycolatopsis mediterranei TaxID=33910 RepID=A0A0H3D170_AMYMU|nr:trypsin-like serine protease [Amycolatopsis mediterranei]ADJ43934.1 secreted trypsin-like serine protease [Amycolatopsis mediterranei U32]AEK40656.1 trypsin-like serine protease [Amycolatopsis mediterranei S699]AFO75647.1 trypsin-like serine protease [Amycolatopsis mediterranei S699]AGT82776.1 trypsin-like serine protease [Amycolatopsis mediterranei RB]KDO04270.1 serine protease [Amycolatopsis mediterranei]